MFSLYMKFEKNQKQLEKNRRFKCFFHEIGQNLPFFEKKINYPLAVESCFAYNYERTSHVFLDGGCRMKVKFRCVDCRQKYSFDADPGEEIRFRCRLCGAVQTFVVPEEPAEENPESTPAPAPAPAAPPPVGLKPRSVPPPIGLKPPAVPLSGGEEKREGARAIPALRLPPRPQTVGTPPAETPEEEVPAVPPPETPPPPPPAPLPFPKSGFVPPPPAEPPSPREEDEVSAEPPEPDIPTVQYDVDRSRDFNPHTGEIVRKSIKWTFRAALLVLLLWGGWFVYGRYFDPAGRIAWKKEMPIPTFHLIENRDGKLTFLAGGTVWQVNSADGTAEKRSETPRLNWYQEKGAMWPVGKSAALFGRENQLARFDFSGKLVWEKSFEADITDVSVGDRAVLVRTVKSQLRSNPRNQFDFEYIRTRRLINLADGAVLQEHTGKQEELFLQEFLLGAQLFRIEPAGKAGEEKGIRMIVADPLSSKEAWRLTTADRFTWGPVLSGELLLFKLRETLHALRASDGAKRWSLKKIGDFCGFVPGREGQEGYFSDAESLCRVDLAAGREVWRKPLAGRVLTGITADRVYLEGATEEVEKPVEEKERKLPNAYEKLAKEDVVIRQILQTPRRPSVRIKRTLACLDAANGEELWLKPEIQGELIADGTRALIYWDSASSGVLSMVNQSNVGYTMLEQLSLSSGGRRYLRKDEIAVAEPKIICGDKLLAAYYDRASGPESPKIGLAAFLLKE